MPLDDRTLSVIKVILWNLCKCVFAFYSGSYIAASIGHGAYKLDEFDYSAPFNFPTWVDLDRCCKFSVQAKINLIAMTFGFAFLLLMLIVSVRKAHWLFILIITVIHITLSCIIKQSFPMLYSYWLCLGVLSFVCLFVADISVFFLNEKTPTT